ncbi:MAG: hypothetical protein M1274_02360 [Actinobacteria bacterium]|nr:hypothetical protein [Actinomycetota bacterium]
MTVPARQDHEHWNREGRAALVLAVLRGEVSIEVVAEGLGTSVDEVESWKGEFLAAAESAPVVPTGEAGTAAAAGADEHETTKQEDVGVWVCTPAGESIAPCLFIQAACEGRLPEEAIAEWQGPEAPSQSSEARFLPVLHGECSFLPARRRAAHLFSSKLRAHNPTGMASDLSLWRFPVRPAGIVLLIEGKDSRALQASGRSSARGMMLRVDKALAWAERQRLPSVIAVMADDPGKFDEGRICRRCAVGADISVIIGPPLGRFRENTERPYSSGLRAQHSMMSLLLGVASLGFDPEYASRILRTLWTVIDSPAKTGRPMAAG